MGVVFSTSGEFRRNVTNRGAVLWLLSSFSPKAETNSHKVHSPLLATVWSCKVDDAEQSHPKND